MSSTALIIPAIVAIVVFLIYMVVIQFFGKQETVRDRMQRMTLGETNNFAATQQQAEADQGDPLYSEQEYSGLGVLFHSLLNLIGVDVEDFRKKSQLRFYRAGLNSPNAAIYYLFFKRIGMVIFLIIAVILVLTVADNNKMLHYAVAVILVVLAFFGADMYIQNERTKREKILQRSFPDALDLLLVCVESGLALDGALSRVCKELGRARPEITQELNRTRLELTLLNNRPQALTNLAERTDMMAFRSLSMTLLQSERFGTSLTDTLRVLSEDYRNTRLMIAEDKAGRLPVMMTVPLIVLMMPALFLIILGPAIIKVLAIIHSS